MCQCFKITISFWSLSRMRSKLLRIHWHQGWLSCWDALTIILLACSRWTLCTYTWGLIQIVSRTRDSLCSSYSYTWDSDYCSSITIGEDGSELFGSARATRLVLAGPRFGRIPCSPTVPHRHLTLTSFRRWHVHTPMSVNTTHIAW